MKFKKKPKVQLSHRSHETHILCRRTVTLPSTSLPLPRPRADRAARNEHCSACCCHCTVGPHTNALDGLFGASKTLQSFEQGVWRQQLRSPLCLASGIRAGARQTRLQQHRITLWQKAPNTSHGLPDGQEDERGDGAQELDGHARLVLSQRNNRIKASVAK